MLRNRTTRLTVAVLALAGAVAVWISVAAESPTPTTSGATSAQTPQATPAAAVDAPSTTAGAIARGVHAPDAFTLIGPESYLTCAEPMNEDGSVNVVIEIPAGSVDKWEVDKSDGALRWEFRDGEPRKVRYLGYPGNYGMIPRTLLPAQDGGDGDPLDVIVLGSAVPRGTVLPARIVGVLRLDDGGEQDDKLLAVSTDTALAEIETLEQLQARFPGVTEIVETWFSNYKGAGAIETLGFGDAQEARAILETAMRAFAAPGTGS